MSRFAALATLNVDDALPDAWVDEVKVLHDYLAIAGADLASAATLTITSEFHRVTGSTTVTTINDSVGSQAKGQLVRLNLVAGLTFGTSGNITTITGSASPYAAGSVATFMWDGTSKWLEVGSGDPIDASQTAAQKVAGLLAATGGLSSDGPTSATFTGTQPADGVFIDSTGQIASFCNAAVTAYAAGAVSDTVARWTCDSNGNLQWGPGGSTALDTTIARSAVSQLKISNNVVLALPAVGSGTVPTTFTPNLSNGPTQRFSVTAGGAAALTIAATSNPPSSTSTCLMVVRIANTGGGTITLSWNAAYVAAQTVALPASVANGASITCLFVWEGTVWRILVAA